MRRRVGAKTFDTEKAELIDTLPDGIQVFRKKGRSTDFFLYNPNGKTGKEMFFLLPPEQAEKYLDGNNSASKRIYKSNYHITISEYDRNRIMRLANRLGLSMPKFLLMLVDEYERKLNGGS